MTVLADVGGLVTWVKEVDLPCFGDDWVLFRYGAAMDGVKRPEGRVGDNTEAFLVAIAAGVSSGDSGSGFFVKCTSWSNEPICGVIPNVFGLKSNSESFEMVKMSLSNQVDNWP